MRSGSGVGVREQHRFDLAIVFHEAQLQMVFADDALARDRELIVERRRGESLAPDLVLEHARGFERAVLERQRAVGFDHALEVGRGEQ